MADTAKYTQHDLAEEISEESADMEARQAKALEELGITR